jgi:hypothetical protein
MGAAALSRDFVLTTAAGASVGVTDTAMTIILPGVEPVIIAGESYERLKAEIARRVSPAAILGKPIPGIGGDDIYIGIRKRQEGG